MQIQTTQLFSAPLPAVPSALDDEATSSQHHLQTLNRDLLSQHAQLYTTDKLVQLTPKPIPKNSGSYQENKRTSSQKRKRSLSPSSPDSRHSSLGSLGSFYSIDAEEEKGEDSGESTSDTNIVLQNSLLSKTEQTRPKFLSEDLLYIEDDETYDYMQGRFINDLL